MIKSNKNNKKKKGFTLVELIAVIAIIGILAAILIPSIGGFISKAKKTKVTEQARTYIMAIESLASENYFPTAAGVTKANVKINQVATNAAFAESVGAATADLTGVQAALPKLKTGLTYDQAVTITTGSGNFEIDSAGILTKVGADTIGS